MNKILACLFAILPIMSSAQAESIFDSKRLIVEFQNQSNALNSTQKRRLNIFVKEIRERCNPAGAVYVLVSGIVEPDASDQLIANAKRKSANVASYLKKDQFLHGYISEETSSAWALSFRNAGLSVELAAKKGPVYVEVVCDPIKNSK